MANMIGFARISARMNHDYREMETMHTAVVTRTTVRLQEGEIVDLLIPTLRVYVRVIRRWKTQRANSGVSSNVGDCAHGGVRVISLYWRRRCSEDEIRDAWNTKFCFIFYASKHRYSNGGRVWQIIGHWFFQREGGWLSIVFGRFRNW